ncbi:MAG: HAD family hydrolase [Pegethrix bostrychoides GSE-TBD4-15B]|jgi:phosphoglycolate phosphatase-like HAD superfamily hydrolase|uniref:HAD family hydrolase n=1 Tax=Pegethrix bostrychoides GSE-TBD4-15B TaxID=2839662 RepID=A0A951P6T6_9CYAN|nr:HAD family hydrolase [Pegethrix bostrychoides GSE-TBD4-15B]
MIAPTVLALDFDGVLCDGMKEYFQIAWRAYCNLWQLEDKTPPAGLAEQFYQVRPLIATGWEMPMLLRALLTGYSPAQMGEDWPGLSQRLIEQEGLTAAQLAAEVDGLRDQWIATDPASWLAEQSLYPGVAERLAVWLEAVQVVIISTKEGRFIQQILQPCGIDFSRLRIFGKEAKQPKHQILRELKAEQPEAVFWFVEDRLQTLHLVQKQPDLGDVQLFLATWGYNTAAEKASVAGDSGIHSITLPQFCDDFAGWYS